MVVFVPSHLQVRRPIPVRGDVKKKQRLDRSVGRGSTGVGGGMGVSDRKMLPVATVWEKLQ